jgi:hypothetical protein
MLTLLAFVAVLVAAFLAWNLYQRFGTDRIDQLNERRRATSKMVSRGEFVDGNRHLAVALAIDQSTFYYENADMQASIDLQWIREIEYDTELATGTSVEGAKVLRIRSGSQTFEFVIPNDIVARWHMMLPARRAMTAPDPAGPPVAAQIASAT